MKVKARDYVMPDFMRIGGVTGWQRAAAIAGAAGIPISTYLYPEVAAHVMRVGKRRIGWNGRTGRTRCYSGLTRSRMAGCTFRMCRAGVEWDEKVVAAHPADSF